MKSLFFKERIYASVIDFLLISILSSIILSVLDISAVDFHKIYFLKMKWTLNYNIGFLAMMLYFSIFDLLSNGTTFGKMITNLKVVQTDSVPKLQTRILRTILKCFLLFSILLPVTFVFYLLKNEVLYDRILKTAISKE